MRWIGIIGTRRRDEEKDFELVKEKFLTLHTSTLDVVVSGGCKEGADRFAELLANEHKLAPLIFRPDKDKLNKELLKVNPRAAYAQINCMRNECIAEASEYLIACVAGDRKGGTENTIKHFERVCKMNHWNLTERLLLV